MDQTRLELLGRLIDRHAGPLVLYARQWCDTPEDVVQEALLDLSRTTRQPDDAVAWLYRAVRNRAISAGRSAQRRRQHEGRAAAGREWFVVTEDDSLDAAAATAALTELPLEEREVIIARLWGGLTFEEIAQLVGCSSSAAHRRYAAGLSALRERLNVPCPTPNHSRKS